MDKLNGYDIWGYFFPGIIFSITLYLIYQIGFSRDLSFDALSGFGNISAFIFFSYFFGFILQSIGRYVQDIIFLFRNNPLRTFLFEKSKILSENEKRMLIAYLESDYANGIDTSNEYDNYSAFCFCNNYITINGLYEKSEKLQSLRGLSRGLAAAFLLNTIMIFIALVVSCDIERINMALCLVFCTISFLILCSNFISFEKHRVGNVCRLYLALKKSIGTQS